MHANGLDFENPWLDAVAGGGMYLGSTNNRVARALLYPRSPHFCDVDLSCRPTNDSALELTFASSTMLMSLIFPHGTYSHNAYRRHQ